MYNAVASAGRTVSPCGVGAVPGLKPSFCTGGEDFDPSHFTFLPFAFKEAQPFPGRDILAISS